jgi:hypothetical protein
MSQGSVHPFRFIIGGMLLVMFMHAPALFAQTVTVSGLVVEQADSTPIGEASIRLADAPLAITDERGRFDIPGVPPGRYVLSVEALGYVSREIELDLRADTTIHIELIPDPIDVEGLLVEGVTIRGNLRDAESGLKLLTGRVTLQPDGRSVTTRSGSFTLKQVARGSSVILVAEAMEHLPTRVQLFVEGDTTVDIMMGVDSVAIRLLDRQARRLASRAESMPYSVNELDRDDIRSVRLPSIGELVRRQLPPGLVDWKYPYVAGGHCIMLDDSPVQYAVLLGVPPELIERVEIYGHKARLISVYSKRYVASLMGKPALPPIRYSENGMSTVCM